MQHFLLSLEFPKFFPFLVFFFASHDTLLIHLVTPYPHPQPAKLMRGTRCVCTSNSGFKSSYSISLKASYSFCTLNLVILSFVSQLWEKGKFWKAEIGFLTGNTGILKAVFLKTITFTNLSDSTPDTLSQDPQKWVLGICIFTRFPGCSYIH